jgi:hypothetical protein
VLKNSLVEPAGQRREEFTNKIKPFFLSYFCLFLAFALDKNNLALYIDYTNVKPVPATLFLIINLVLSKGGESNRVL